MENFLTILNNDTDTSEILCVYAYNYLTKIIIKIILPTT